MTGDLIARIEETPISLMIAVAYIRIIDSTLNDDIGIIIQMINLLFNWSSESLTQNFFYLIFNTHYT
jgi:hypothetical protein